MHQIFEYQPNLKLRSHCQAYSGRDVKHYKRAMWVRL